MQFEFMDVRAPIACALMLILMRRYLHKQSALQFGEYLNFGLLGFTAGYGLQIVTQMPMRELPRWLASLYQHSFAGGFLVTTVLLLTLLAVVYVLAVIYKALRR